MNLPLALAKKLLMLQGGSSLPASQLRHEVVDAMVEQGVLHRQLQGRSKVSIYLPDPQAFAHYLHNHFGIPDLADYVQHYADPNLSGADAVVIGSDSKLRKLRPFKGFLVNAYDPIPCVLNGKEWILAPVKGSCAFVTDFESFLPAPGVTVVGMENPENFREIRRLRYLFADMQPLFVSRYPQGKDLLRWLAGIPNPYLHFGDIDFAGLNIYWNEYKAVLGARASFFLPDGAAALMASHGNRALYVQQSLQIDRAGIDEVAVLEALALIERFGKGLEQEVFLG
jgi:hypothetical protein